MAKSCLSCAHLALLPFGEGASRPFCTRNPPTVEVIRGNTPPSPEHPQGQSTVNLFGWYPPQPKAPCGEHKLKRNSA